MAIAACATWIRCVGGYAHVTELSRGVGRRTECRWSSPRMRGRNECQETDDTPLPPQEKLDPSATGAPRQARQGRRAEAGGLRVSGAGRRCGTRTGGCSCRRCGTGWAQATGLWWTSTSSCGMPLGPARLCPILAGAAPRVPHPAPHTPCRAAPETVCRARPAHTARCVSRADGAHTWAKLRLRCGPQRLPRLLLLGYINSWWPKPPATHTASQVYKQLVALPHATPCKGTPAARTHFRHAGLVALRGCLPQAVPGAACRKGGSVGGGRGAAGSKGGGGLLAGKGWGLEGLIVYNRVKGGRRHRRGRTRGTE